MTNLDNVLEEWIPYRLETLKTFQAVWNLAKETKEGREVQIVVDGKTRLVGNVSMIANPICEIGLIHARALLEFLGLSLIEGKLKTIERKRRADDIAIEHFKANGVALERLTPEQALSDYPGDPEDARAAFMAVFEWTNKGGGLKYQLQHWVNESSRPAIVVEPYARHKRRVESSTPAFLEDAC